MLLNDADGACRRRFPALRGGERTRRCTCGPVSMVVTMVSIIRAPGWCNDKGVARLSLISSSTSIYYPHRHEYHHTVTVAAGCNLAVRRAFPAAALPHVQRSSTYPAVFLLLCCLSSCTVIFETPPSLLLFRSTEISYVSVSSSKDVGSSLSV